MLTKSLVFGLVAPMLFRAKAMTPVNDVEAAPIPAAPPPLPPMPELPGLPLAPMATVDVIEVSDELPWPELPQMKTPEEAVAEFLADMIEYCGGEAIRFCRLAWSYEDMRRGRAKSDDCAGYAPRPWPPIKAKTLSQLLCALGCEREQRNMRSQGEGRPTFILIPVAADVVGDEIEAIEDFRLAA